MLDRKREEGCQSKDSIPPPWKWIYNLNGAIRVFHPLCSVMCGEWTCWPSKPSQCFGGTYGETEKAVLNYNLYAVKDQ